MFRDTFEGDTWTPWNTSVSGNGDWDRFTEDEDNLYASQAHGDFSLWLKDPNDTSYANAYKTFTNSASEYMTEFYLWIYHTHAHIDSFPLCVLLYESAEEDISYRTDIALVLDTVGMVPNHHPYVIRVEDANGFHTACYLDTSDIDTWHKIQIYRKPPEAPLPAKVVLYLDGDSIGTYNPMNSSYVSNKISLGTTEADSLSDGEVFYDDVIVTTPPKGEHPRLLFTADEIPELRNRMDITTPQPFGTSYDTLWGIIYKLAFGWGFADSFVIPYATLSGSDTTITLHYPFDRQPPRHNPNIDGSSIYWWKATEGIAERAYFLAFAYTMMPESTRYFERVKPILLGVGKWKQWADPDYRRDFYYYNFSTFWFPFGISLAYDMVFNELNNYERMSIQNTLLTLGLGQMWLERSYGSYGTIFTNGGSIFNSTMGLSALGVYDDPNTSIELDTAKTKLNEFWTSDSFCGNDGDYFEGVGYGGFASRYFEWFGSAYFHSTRDDSFLTIPFLGEFPTWLVYSYLPPDKVVNFSDCRDWYIQTGSVSGALQKHDNKYGQWYLSKTVQQRIQEQHLGRQALAIFLEGRSDLESVYPATLPEVKEFKTTGWVIMRKGWNENGWLSAFKSNSFNYQYPSSMAHLHRDNNNFIFGWKGDWWIGDPGYDIFDPARHNVIMVGTPDHPDTHWQIDKSGGKILRYGETEHYTFAEGDASDAHDSLGLWFRKIVMSKDDPLIVVMDRVEPEDGDTHKYYYLLQTSGKVNINGDTAGIYFEGGEDTLFAIPGFPDNMNISSDTFVIDDTIEWTRIIYESPLANTLCFLMLFSPSKESIFNFADESIMGTQTRDKVIIFGKGVEPLPMVEYKLIYTGVDSSFNFLVDLIPDTTYKVIVRDKDMNTLSMEELLSTDEGTLGFTVEIEEDTIIVFVGTDLISDTPLATAMNNQRKIYVDSDENPCFVYKAGWKVFYDYSEDGGKTFDESTFGDGSFPALARNPDTTSESSCAAVWVNNRVIFFSRYSYASGWSEPCSLITTPGTNSIHYFPPSLAIDDSGTAHLAWGIIAEPVIDPDSVTYELYYSTFNARVDEPSISSEDTLDEAKEYPTQWLNVKGYVSLDLYNDTISVVVWSRPIGAGKDTIYCKQETSSGWPPSPDVVSSSSSKASNPFCDIIGSIIHVVWEEEGLIKHRQRYIHTDWMSIETVSNTLLTSRNPQIVNGDICVYTEVLQFVPNHRSHVVYRKRSGQGTWGSSNILESTRYESEYPQSYFCKEALHTVWTEGNNAPYKVKYKKKSEP